MHIHDLLQSQSALPSIPKVVAMVLSELNRDEPDARVVSQLINSDLGLAARMLALANSAQFQLTRTIGNVPDALAILGFNEVRALTTAAAVAGAFKAVPGIELNHFWRFSLDVAKLSRKLAMAIKGNGPVAFTTGLIHASGELVMHLGMPQQMRTLNEQVQPLVLRRAKIEQRTLGYSFAEVGAGFAGKWNFPLEMVDAIAHQNAPFDNDVYEPLAGVVHLAAWRARANESKLTPGELADQFPHEIAVTIGVDIDNVIQEQAIDWTTKQETSRYLA
jgi:HD-like signal output (HDOD) protein